MERAHRKGMLGVSQILIIAFAILILIVFILSFKQQTGGFLG